MPSPRRRPATAVPLEPRATAITDGLLFSSSPGSEVPGTCPAPLARVAASIPSKIGESSESLEEVRRATSSPRAGRAADARQRHSVYRSRRGDLSSQRRGEEKPAAKSDGCQGGSEPVGEHLVCAADNLAPGPALSRDRAQESLFRLPDLSPEQEAAGDEDEPHQSEARRGRRRPGKRRLRGSRRGRSGLVAHGSRSRSGRRSRDGSRGRSRSRSGRDRRRAALIIELVVVSAIGRWWSS